jgi:ribonuclease HII
MKNFILESPLPDCVRSEPCWLGIDEAGRGPVLGPMVYGICFSPISLKEKFGQMGFADSKTMTEEQREVIFDKMLEAKDMLGGPLPASSIPSQHGSERTQSGNGDSRIKFFMLSATSISS